MSVPSIPPLSAGNLAMKASVLPILPESSGMFNNASAPNASNAGQIDLSGSVTTDQLLYDVFNTYLGSGSNGGGFQTTPNNGLRPEDAAYAQSLYGANPLQAYQSVSSYLTLDNFLPGFSGNSTGQTTQDSGSFNAYKASFLGNISPQNAVDLVNLLAGPILQ